ncbi:PLP-dependent cysteine synthase family protein [Mesoterricola silvestris]|uniref:Cysteine synthase n=1 Tax=Mesoterricola silvestris TaxID=2927979 RepID=A0AA48GMW6_9BACT|nr:cysteine synthase family protein [Mesoterricola silvestris]BDU74352.1 cysteine synthase [Mesoterricola silvestris]
MAFQWNNGLCPSAVEAIGQTPLVELSRLVAHAGLSGRILAKVEYLNPGLSKKDRVARQMIEDAEGQGLLRPRQTVVELTSGNTGTGLAILCAVKGYHFVAVMSAGNSVERVRMMAALGAEVILVDQAKPARAGEVSGADLRLVEQEAHRITLERGAFRADQFLLEGNFRAHYLHTGPEILAQAGCVIDGFCDFVGSGGSFAGCSAAFKERNPATFCCLVEPERAAILAGQPVTRPQHPIQGGGYSMARLAALQAHPPDAYLQVSGQEAARAAQDLARLEGLFAGYSSGANLAAAKEMLATTHPGATLVVLLNDSGLKYLSTDLWPTRLGCETFFLDSPSI